MKIHSIELAGYRRFALRDIQYLRIDFDKKVHQILGTNGSGKSSLLQELSPWPAISQDYHKDGYKRIVVSHHQMRYTLLNQFSQPAVHSLLQHDTAEGTELNQSGTWSEQKEWVYRLFGLSQEIHGLMLGQVRFTAMSPNERRQWFTRLSDVSYTYALSVFQRLKEQARDVQGALKIAQTQAVQEASQCLTEDQEHALRAEVEILRYSVDVLLNRKPTVTGYAHEYSQQLHQSDGVLRKLSQDYLTLRKQFLNLEGFAQVEAIDAALQETHVTIRSHQALLEKLAEQLESVQTALDTALAQAIDGAVDLPTQLQNLEHQLKQHSQYGSSLLVWTDPDAALSALQMLTGPLVDLCAALPVLSTPYSHDTVVSLQRRHSELNESLGGLESALQTLQIKLAEQYHHRDHAQTTCPQCTHTWAIGYDATLVDQWTAQQTTLRQQHTETQHAVQRTAAELELLTHYTHCIRTYQSYVQQWPILQPLWEALKAHGWLRTQPQYVSTWLTDVQQDLIHQAQHRALQKEHARIRDLYQRSLQQESGWVDRLRQELHRLQADYQEYTASLQQAQALHHRYTQYKTTVTKLQRIQTEIEYVLTQRQHLQTHWETLLMRDTLNQLIQAIRLELSTAEQKLSQLTIQRALAASLQQQVEDLTAQSQALKLLTHELSPTTGLIAQSLLGFIHGYVNQMNRFIQRGWLYPMTLCVDLPDGEDTVELDYKFQVQINHGTCIPDIGKTSSGMQEMIDLAFKVVAMQYLGFGDYPLCLDEFSTRMDPAHRQSAYQVIHELIEDSRFSQIFIVSHHYETYGSMRHADTTVLCSANVALGPDVSVNTCVQFGFQ